MTSLSTNANASPKGFYFGLELGKAAYYGEVLKDTLYSQQLLSPEGGSYNYHPTTEFPSSFALGLNLGYNILGYGAVEMWGAITGSDILDDDHNKGSGHFEFNAKYFPTKHFEIFEKYNVEAALFLGFGYSVAGYKEVIEHTKFNIETQDYAFKAWNSAYGFQINYYLIELVSLNLKFNFINPTYDECITDWDAGSKQQLIDPAESTIFVPSFGVSFHPGF